MKITPIVKKRYMILAKYFEQPRPAVVSGNFMKAVGYYDATDEHDAFRQFLWEFAPSVKEAQRFYEDVYVIEMPKTARKFNLRDTFGELAKFPNPELFSDADFTY